MDLASCPIPHMRSDEVVPTFVGMFVAVLILLTGIIDIRKNAGVVPFLAMIFGGGLYLSCKVCH